MFEEPAPALAEALKAMPPRAVALRQFSLLQALDADVEALEEVSA